MDNRSNLVFKFIGAIIAIALLLYGLLILGELGSFLVSLIK